ncbi:hypothetical protein [Pandoraea anhela]|uniref:Uncharacterized protein n=1 Tax=Pandoraea anhela TaxID=2508295 RepID=A0A5E4RLN0_9BURK|nr:hypothetical protein [Pandoraea anhela]VVD63424.1 hypothetical protein PAN31108_00228 [Pandoraea anhela]
MSAQETSEPTVSGAAPVGGVAIPIAEQAADAMIEHRYPSDVDRLREVVGTDVLPFYRDEQAIVASRQAGERWPHLVAVAVSRERRDAGHGAAHDTAPRSPQAN